MKDESLEEKLMDLTERVTLLEVTRKFDENARPTHIVESKYHILADKSIDIHKLLYGWVDNHTESEVWEMYPDKLKELQEILSPKVAKEYLDAFLRQNGIYVGM